MDTTPVTISVILPAYQEELHIRRVIGVIDEQLASAGVSHEIIVVDDGSTDSTWDILEEQCRLLPSLRGIRLSRNFGKESAVCAGLENARGEAAIVLDADFQHPPDLIPLMVKKWQESDVDIVECVKADRGKESPVSRIGSAVFYAALNRLSGYNLKGASDFKLLDRKVLKAWLTMGERNLFFRGMISWLGFRRITIPFEVPERTGGKSRWSVWRLIKLAITGLTAFSSIPLMFVNLLGILFFVFGSVMGARALYFKFNGQAFSGFTTVIILQLVVGGLLMISLGIIGVYIARIYDETKNRPRYVVFEDTGESS
jgi:glycosyltransferase involved in cell wall biosynthesis